MTGAADAADGITDATLNLSILEDGRDDAGIDSWFGALQPAYLVLCRVLPLQNARARPRRGKRLAFVRTTTLRCDTLALFRKTVRVKVRPDLALGQSIPHCPPDHRQ
jgi:hypothetical protein